MYWVSSLVKIKEDPHVMISYFHINPITKVVEIHYKVSKDEDEFKLHYEKVKSL